MSWKEIVLGVHLFFISVGGFAQTGPANNTIKDDTAIVNNLIKQSREASEKDTSADKEIQLATQARILAAKINYPQGEALAFKYIGIGFYRKGNNTEAMQNFRQSLTIFELLRDTVGIANIQNNMGVIYLNQGDKTKALEFLFNSLRNAEKMKDRSRIVLALFNIGNHYQDNPATYDKALQYYQRAYPLSEELKDRELIGYISAGIGEIYKEKGISDSALFYFWKAEQAFQSTIDISSVLINIGNVYEQRKENATAQKFYQQAYDSAITSESKIYQTRALKNLAGIFGKSGKSKKAIASYLQAEQLAKEMGLNIELRDIYKGLATTYINLSDYSKAYQYQHLLMNAKDSIYNKDLETKLNNMAFNSDMIKKDDSIFLRKREEIQELRIDKITSANQTRTFLLLGGLALLLLSSGFLFYTNYRKQKVNRLLLQQKEQIEKTLAELQATQAQLIQREKMASLGELTAGIAHEIQNPLNFVNNFSEVTNELIGEMVEEVDKGNTTGVKEIAQDVQQNLEKIIHHGKRADAIVKGMLQHSRSSTGVKEPTDINVLADEFVRLSYHGLRAKDKSFNATIKTDYDERIGQINIIPQDIGRVILNLITNAFYEVTEKKKSAIAYYEPTVSVSTKMLGSQAEIRIKDNGNGIADNIVEKIFQPFFTTKPTGEGTGLGLSLSYDIIKAHRGELKVESKEGEGAEFIIQLPMD